jgi:hypothetical protein
MHLTGRIRMPAPVTPSGQVIYRDLGRRLVL